MQTRFGGTMEAKADTEAVTDIGCVADVEANIGTMTDIETVANIGIDSSRCGS